VLFHHQLPAAVQARKSRSWVDAKSVPELEVLGYRTVDAAKPDDNHEPTQSPVG
jgi:hypothetical protein